MSEQIIPIVLGIALMAVVFELVRRRRLRERHAVFWILLGVVLVLVGALPAATETITSFLGFELPSNLMFFVSIVVIFALALQYAIELTRLEQQVRSLAEEVALLRAALGRVEGSDCETRPS